MTHSYRRGQYNYIISSILYILIHERHQDDSIHVHLSISRGQHVCITHRFDHFQLMSQGESDVTERKEEDIALCFITPGVCRSPSKDNSMLVYAVSVLLTYIALDYIQSQVIMPVISNIGTE